MHALVALGFLVRSCFGQGFPLATEYVLNFDSQVYLCPDDVSKLYMDPSKMQVMRVDDTAVMTGYVNYLQGLTENTMLEIQVRKEIANRFEMIASHEICDICEELENEDSDYKGYIQYFDVPKSCPFEPKEYFIHDFAVDSSDLPVNAQNAGRYQATMNIYKTNGNCLEAKTLLACMNIDFVIEPDA